jgi:hypothetical protein
MEEMVTFCAITEMVFPRIGILLYCPVKEITGFFNLVANLWQINKAKWCSMLFYQMLQGYTMEGQRSVTQIKAFLWKIVALLNKVKIGIFHFQTKITLGKQAKYLF